MATHDLDGGTVQCLGQLFRFALPARERLLLEHDVDWIAATLTHCLRIEAFEARHLLTRP